jgi:uncharacterized protein (TIGR02600 family)
VAANVIHTSKLKDANGKDVLALPMRVKWLYQMRDGTFAAPDSGGVIPGASKENPPVARVAFWTDDESGKVNVNTAGENTYWDTPMTSCPEESGRVDGSGQLIYNPNELGLAAAQPQKNEYQRFPGHPATTCLSPVLRWLAPSNMTEVDFKEAIYRLQPRLVGGYGSTVGGTRNADRDLFPGQDFRIYDRDRLFANLDEYWFRPDRSPIGGSGLYKVFRSTSSGGIADTRLPNTTFTPQALERLRFFLTATSRAPDLNLWGKPRICIWPVHEVDDQNPVNSKRSAYDDLMVFCSTVATKPYIFARRDPWSPTNDLETAGAQIRLPSGTYLNAGRNKELLDNYLKDLCSKPIPGVGKSMASKYSATISGAYTEMDRILLSIFDYIRCTNLVDTGAKDPAAMGTNVYKFAYTPAYTSTQPPDYSGNTRPNMGSGQVAPTVRYDGTTPAIKGFGRFVTVAEAGLMFYVDWNLATLPLDDPMPTDLLPKGWAGNVMPTNYLPIRCVLLPEMFTVAPGYPGISEGYAFRVTETDEKLNPTRLSIDVGGASKNIELAEADITKSSVNYVNVDAWRIADGRFFTATRGFNNQFWFDAANCSTAGQRQPKIFAKPNAPGTAGVTSYQKFPFYSKRIFLPITNGVLPTSFKFNGGSLTFEFYSLNVPKDTLPPPPAFPATNPQAIQRVCVNFPPVTLPVPRPGLAAFQERVKAAPGDAGRSWISTTNDVIRTMESGGKAHGDIRLVAGLGVVPGSYFATSGSPAMYANTGMMVVHNFRNGWGRNYVGNQTAYISTGATVRGGNISPSANDKFCKTPLTNGSAVAPGDPSAAGDYDRFVSKQVDGAYINKPDEGNVRFNLSDDFAGGGCLPYYRGANGFEEVGQSYFSPNRLISSAVMFGSLPTGMSPTETRPWETLLFSPAVASNHKGAQSPPDHYLLDLFNMPVVEPYAISEPLSTAGRINLNCRLAPFGYVKVAGRGYIERTTGLHAVLKGLKQLVIPNGTPNTIHQEGPYNGSGHYRYNIDRFATIRNVINPRLDTKGYFKSPTEICELDLLLDSGFTSAASRKSFWQNATMTGDNGRERAYSHIYPRLTTKSNTYTVHVWAQSIVKNPNTPSGDWNKFDETRDRVTGEYRGSTTIERYIDPNDKALDGYDAAKSTATDLDRYYRFRVLASKRFIVQ